MHSESLTQAILGTALLFNTVFEIPDDMSLMGQIFGVGIVTYMLFWSIEKVREWEMLLRKKSAGRQPVCGQRKINISLLL